MDERLHCPRCAKPTLWPHAKRCLNLRCDWVYCTHCHAYGYLEGRFVVPDKKAKA